MLAIAIALIAGLGMIYDVDPPLRPYIDTGMDVLLAVIMLNLGIRFNDWLTAFGNRPHWRRKRPNNDVQAFLRLCH